MDEYEIKKSALIADLRSNCESLIHISFDLWTSPNSLAFMAVVIHYIDSSYKNRTRLIALRHLSGSYCGENQAELLIEIIKEFELADRLGYFVADNAGSNDTCNECVFKELKFVLMSAQRSYRRLRCYGHILNLAANVYLWGKEPESFEAEILVNNIL